MSSHSRNRLFDTKNERMDQTLPRDRTLPTTTMASEPSVSGTSSSLSFHSASPVLTRLDSNSGLQSRISSNRLTYDCTNTCALPTSPGYPSVSQLLSAVHRVVLLPTFSQSFFSFYSFRTTWIFLSRIDTYVLMTESYRKAC